MPKVGKRRTSTELLHRCTVHPLPLEWKSCRRHKHRSTVFIHRRPPPLDASPLLVLVFAADGEGWEETRRRRRERDERYLVLPCPHRRRLVSAAAAYPLSLPRLRHGTATVAAYPSSFPHGL
nr:hypothetical protein Iba_chr04cCG11700 [Ipomoea batatas]